MVLDDENESKSDARSFIRFTIY